MAMESVKYLLIGGGCASAQAAVGLREVDSEGSAMIVCGEPRMPYDRPPLSKGFLNYKPSDPEDIESKDASFYTDKGIQVRTGVRAERLDRSARTVSLSDGSTVSYERLLLATGASPKKPNIPGIGLKNVFLFRTVDDADRVRQVAKEARNVVLIGAGYIGMEVAASLRSLGKEVTIVDPSSQPWSRFASPITGNFLRSYFENQGVQFLLGQGVDEIVGREVVEKVRAGAHAPAADLVIVGTGVELNTSLAQEAGLTVDASGVHADETLRAVDDERIWVAGDIAALQDPTLGKRWHAEHYMHAKWTGLQAGRNMAGAAEPYRRVPYFFSDMFDLMMVLRGDPTDVRAARVLGDVDTAEYVELYCDKSGRVAMALAFTRDGERYDPIVDALEKVVLARPAASEVKPEDVGLA